MRSEKEIRKRIRQYKKIVMEGNRSIGIIYTQVINELEWVLNE